MPLRSGAAWEQRPHTLLARHCGKRRAAPERWRSARVASARELAAISPAVHSCAPSTRSQPISRPPRHLQRARRRQTPLRSGGARARGRRVCTVPGEFTIVQGTSCRPAGRPSSCCSPCASRWRAQTAPETVCYRITLCASCRAAPTPVQQLGPPLPAAPLPPPLPQATQLNARLCTLLLAMPSAAGRGWRDCGWRVQPRRQQGQRQHGGRQWRRVGSGAGRAERPAAR